MSAENPTSDQQECQNEKTEKGEKELNTNVFPKRKDENSYAERCEF